MLTKTILTLTLAKYKNSWRNEGRTTKKYQKLKEQQGKCFNTPTDKMLPLVIKVVYFGEGDYRSYLLVNLKKSGILQLKCSFSTYVFTFLFLPQRLPPGFNIMTLDAALVTECVLINVWHLQFLATVFSDLITPMYISLALLNIYLFIFLV